MSKVSASANKNLALQVHESLIQLREELEAERRQNSEEAEE